MPHIVAGVTPLTHTYIYCCHSIVILTLLYFYVPLNFYPQNLFDISAI